MKLCKCARVFALICVRVCMHNAYPVCQEVEAYMAAIRKRAVLCRTNHPVSILHYRNEKRGRNLSECVVSVSN